MKYCLTEIIGKNELLRKKEFENRNYLESIKKNKTFEIWIQWATPENEEENEQISRIDENT